MSGAHPTELEDVAKWLFAMALLAGGAFGLFVTFHGFQIYQAAVAARGADWFQFDGWRILECGAGVVAIALTLAFATCFLRKDPPPSFTILLYAASYAACFTTSWLALIVAGKNFDGAGVLANLVAAGGRWFVPAALVAAVAVLTALRVATHGSRLENWLAIYLVAAPVTVVLVLMQDVPRPGVAWLAALAAILIWGAAVQTRASHPAH